MTIASAPRLAIFMPSFGGGGVERMMINLARGLADSGVAVDILSSNAGHPYLTDLGKGIRVIPLAERSRRRRIASLADYLRREQPAAALASKIDAGAVLTEARRVAGVATRVAVRIATTVSIAFARRSLWRRWRQQRRLRQTCRQADIVIAVSQGVADDVAALTGMAPGRIQALPNPVITPQLAALAREPATHPWLSDKTQPVIISVGRLSRAKDFPTLIEAFASLRRDTACRLLIVGEGRQRRRLERLVHKLGLGDDVALPGFGANPYASIARADLFVLSSRWEGSPNALTEAMALGCPVVSTDCPSGPREILAGGKYGALVPPGDIPALTRAMRQALRSPVDPALLRAAVTGYSLANSIAAYRRALGLA